MDASSQAATFCGSDFTTCLRVGTGPAGRYGSEAARSAGCGQHPGPLLPWRRVPDVLRVSTLEIGHPLLLVILVEADDPPIRTHPRSQPANSGNMAGMGPISAQPVPSTTGSTDKASKYRSSTAARSSASGGWQ